MASCGIRAALQILHSNTRAPQNVQAAAEVNSKVAVDADDDEPKLIKAQCAAIKQAAQKFTSPPAKLAKRMATGLSWPLSQARVVGGKLTWLPSDVPRVAQRSYVTGSAPGPRPLSRPRRQNCGQPPRLLLLTVGQRKLNQVRRCSNL